MGWIVRPCHFLLICAACVIPGYEVAAWSRKNVTTRLMTFQVPGLQHSCNIVSLATFRPTSCLIRIALFCMRATNQP